MRPRCASSGRPIARGSASCADGSTRAARHRRGRSDAPREEARRGGQVQGGEPGRLKSQRRTKRAKSPGPTRTSQLVQADQGTRRRGGRRSSSPQQRTREQRPKPRRRAGTPAGHRHRRSIRGHDPRQERIHTVSKRQIQDGLRATVATRTTAVTPFRAQAVATSWPPRRKAIRLAPAIPALIADRPRLPEPDPSLSAAFDSAWWLRNYAARRAACSTLCAYIAGCLGTSAPRLDPRRTDVQGRHRRGLRGADRRPQPPALRQLHRARRSHGRGRRLRRVAPRQTQRTTDPPDESRACDAAMADRRCAVMALGQRVRVHAQSPAGSVPACARFRNVSRPGAVPATGLRSGPVHCATRATAGPWSWRRS